MRKFKSWVACLSKTGKILLIGLTALGLLTIASAASSSDSDKIELAANEKESQQIESADTKPTIETKTLTETIEIPFESTTINDSGLEKGKTEIRTVGANGVKTLTYEQAYTDGVAGEKVLVKEEVTEEPITEVTAVGTKPLVQLPPAPTSNCDPNYSGCVPIASDVDCAGGSGNGPAYVSGPVYVTGNDIYGLDRDGNGVACE